MHKKLTAFSPLLHNPPSTGLVSVSSLIFITYSSNRLFSLFLLPQDQSQIRLNFFSSTISRVFYTILELPIVTFYSYLLMERRVR